MFVAVMNAQHLLDQGYTEARIALRQNAGNAKVCSKGHNGITSYDSCAYVASVINKLAIK